MHMHQEKKELVSTRTKERKPVATCGELAVTSSPEKSQFSKMTLSGEIEKLSRVSDKKMGGGFVNVVGPYGENDPIKWNTTRKEKKT
jgi:hypothetical protein